MKQNPADPKKVRFFAYGISLGFHLLVLAVGSLFLPSQISLGFYVPGPISIELSPLVPNVPVRIPVQKAPPKLLEPIPAGRLIPPVKRTSPHDAEGKRREQLLEKKQAGIDRKIGAVRAKLHRALKRNRVPAPPSQGFQVISVEMHGKKWDEYLANLRRKVLEAWYPRLIRAEGELSASEARLDFVLSREGEIKRCEVSEWKGSEKFRDLSLASFRQSSPFGPIPVENADGKASESLSISLFFYYQ